MGHMVHCFVPYYYCNALIIENHIQKIKTKYQKQNSSQQLFAALDEVGFVIGG